MRQRGRPDSEQESERAHDRRPGTPLSFDPTIPAAIVVALAGLVGVGLTLFTLPGIWFSLVVALLCWWWVPSLFSYWTFVAAFGVAILAEVVDVAASALGASRAGGGRSGAWGSIAGALLGAIAGSLLIPVPIIGTIAGGVIGAGAGAVIGERGIAGKPWGDSLRIGRGAMVGRFVALVIKTALAGVSGVLLAVAAFVP